MDAHSESILSRCRLLRIEHGPYGSTRAHLGPNFVIIEKLCYKVDQSGLNFSGFSHSQIISDH